MPSCADPWLFGWRTAWVVRGSYLYAPEFVALLVHVGFAHCYWMTATGANHLVGLMRNLVVTGPWPGLMTSGPDRSLESAHCCQIWSCWLSMSWKVRCTYLFLSVAGTGLQLRLL